jgi:hypothetical protein
LQGTARVRTSGTSQELDFFDTASRSNLLPGLAADSNTTRPDPIVLPVAADSRTADAATLQGTEGIWTSGTSQELDIAETSSRSNLLPGLAADSNTTRPDPIVLPVVAWHPDCLASQYEQNRTPRVPTSGTLRYSVAALRREAQCPVCMEVLTQAQFVQACKHRFCLTCIKDAMRESMDCPLCRARIVTTRHVWSDERLDQLLGILDARPVVSGGMKTR